jgi:hypothetical protein
LPNRRALAVAALWTGVRARIELASAALPRRWPRDTIACGRARGGQLAHHHLAERRRLLGADRAGAGLRPAVGDNGAGKTNVLEAVSLLTPGRGLRGAALSRDGAERRAGRLRGRGAARRDRHRHRHARHRARAAAGADQRRAAPRSIR